MRGFSFPNSTVTMSLKVEPSEIVFPTTLNQTSSCTLRLSNTGRELIAYKVKTTAPNNYFVTPKAGVISPGQTAEIKVTLQQQTTDPSQNADRFLVQSAPCPTTEGLSREEWQRLDKFAVSEQRLQVSFRNTAAAPAAPSLVRPAPVDKDISFSDLRAKHEELTHYAHGLEREKAKLEEDLKLRSKVALRTVAAGSSGYSLVQLILAMIVAALIARASAVMGF